MRLRSRLANAFIAAAGLAAALALAEAGTRLFFPQPLSGSWLVYGPQGILMNRAGGPPTRNELPLHRVVHYAFNSHNQRGREEPDPAAARVLVLGDSFTFGYGLAFDDTYVSGLQRRLDARHTVPRVQLLNAATGGWGTADELAYLEAFGDGLGLSAVVVFVSFGDPSRSIDQGLFDIRPDRQGLTPVDRSARESVLKRMLEGNRVYAFLLEHSQFLQLVRVAAVNAAAKAPAGGASAAADDPAQQELFRLMFRRMAAWCAARDLPLTVLTTGWPIFRFPWLDPMMREEGIHFRDLHDPVAGAIGPDGLEDHIIARDGHPNERGARVIEAAAWPILNERLTALSPRQPGRR